MCKEKHNLKFNELNISNKFSKNGTTTKSQQHFNCTLPPNPCRIARI